MAQRIINDTFQYSGTPPFTMPTTIWAKEAARNMPQIVSASTDTNINPFIGNRMCRCNWNDDVASDQPDFFETAILNTGDYTDELFIRAWYARDLNHNLGVKFLRIFLQSPDLDDYTSTLNGGTTNGCSEEGFNSNDLGYTTYDGFAGGDTTRSLDVWHKIEKYWNHVGGIRKIWHDDILVENESGHSYPRKHSSLFLTSNPPAGGAGDATNHMYFQHVEVFSDSGAGEATTGLMSDASIQAAAGRRGSSLGGLG